MSNQSKMVDRYLELCIPKPATFYFRIGTDHECVFPNHVSIRYVWDVYKLDGKNNTLMARFYERDLALEFCLFKNGEQDGII